MEKHQNPDLNIMLAYYDFIIKNKELMLQFEIFPEKQSTEIKDFYVNNFSTLIDIRNALINKDFSNASELLSNHAFPNAQKSKIKNVIAYYTNNPDLNYDAKAGLDIPKFDNYSELINMLFNIENKIATGLENALKSDAIKKEVNNLNLTMGTLLNNVITEENKKLNSFEINLMANVKKQVDEINELILNIHTPLAEIKQTYKILDDTYKNYEKQSREISNKEIDKLVSKLAYVNNSFKEEVTQYFEENTKHMIMHADKKFSICLYTSLATLVVCVMLLFSFEYKHAKQLEQITPNVVDGVVNLFKKGK